NERVAKLQSGDEVRFGQALLATGANVRRLRVDGCQLDGIHYLRTFGNSDAIRAEAENAEHVVMIGGSLIGTELAASLTALGKKCAIVMPEAITLELPSGSDVGAFFHRLLEDQRVHVHAGAVPDRLEGS